MVCAAAEQVSGNTDLLTNILERVPAKPLITFKTVSKVWSALISDRQFQITHTRHNPQSLLSGFYYQNRIWSIKIDNRIWSYEIEPISFLGSPSSIPKISLENVRQSAPTESSGIRILDSCNGLILCYNPKKLALSILNPTTGSHRLLPERLNPGRQANTRPNCFLAFDPSKPYHYKVLNQKYYSECDCEDECGEEASATFDFFSSENESCKEVIFQGPRFCRFGHFRVVFWNGALNWISEYDFHIRFIVEEHKFTSVRIHARGEVVAFFGESGHNLHLVKCSKKGARRFDVFEMNKDSNSWVPKLQFNVEPLEAMRPPSALGRSEFSVLSIERESSTDNLSFVFGMHGKILSYRINKDATIVTMNKVFGKYADDNLISLKFTDFHPFIQSLAPV